MADTIVLAHAGARAEIARRGAELLAWRVGDLDLLWTADPVWWARTSPILFPVVGWSRGGRIRVGGRSYPMGVHGFAADGLFEVEGREDDAARFTLRDDPDTRRQFPFPFRLAVEYRLAATALSARSPTRTTVRCPMRWGFTRASAGRSREARRRTTRSDSRNRRVRWSPRSLLAGSFRRQGGPCLWKETG